MNSRQDLQMYDTKISQTAFAVRMASLSGESKQRGKDIAFGSPRCNTYQLVVHGMASAL